ncbi:MAG: type II toxin-antitoxin system VapC family toxin [Anaerolineae bacterium]|nr:type II toxin-antitoxin system VapC family toxin [Anaerolineae bacterium]
MNYLLDTHTFLWFINDEPALSATAKALIVDLDNVVYISVASLWEMAIKVSLGRLVVPLPFADFIGDQLVKNSITLLDIKLEHVGIVATLPFHHRDPFDRLIVAQSQSENLPIIGKDELLDAYGIQRHW